MASIENLRLLIRLRLYHVKFCVVWFGCIFALKIACSQGSGLHSIWLGCSCARMGLFASWSIWRCWRMEHSSYAWRSWCHFTLHRWLFPMNLPSSACLVIFLIYCCFSLRCACRLTKKSNPRKDCKYFSGLMHNHKHFMLDSHKVLKTLARFEPIHLTIHLRYYTVTKQWMSMTWSFGLTTQQ